MRRTRRDGYLRILVRANCSAAFHFGDGLKTNEGRWCVGRSWNGRSSTYFVTASSLLRSYVTSFSALWHTRRDRLVEAGVGLSCAREAKLPQMKRRRGDLLVHWYCTGVEQGHWMGTSATVRILCDRVHHASGFICKVVHSFARFFAPWGIITSHILSGSPRSLEKLTHDSAPLATRDSLSFSGRPAIVWAKANMGTKAKRLPVICKTTLPLPRRSTVKPVACCAAVDGLGRGKGLI